MRLKPVIAKKAKENLVTHTECGYQGCQKSDKAEIDTKKELAKAAGVSHDTIAKVDSEKSEKSKPLFVNSQKAIKGRYQSKAGTLTFWTRQYMPL